MVMEELKKLEDAIKQKDRTQDDVINYLLASKKQMREESKLFVKTAKFQEIRQRLNELRDKK